MTDKEIIKALECCMSNSDSIIDEFCEQCPYQSANLQCMDEMVKDAHHLITCQKSQIEDLKEALEERIQRIKELEAEVERQYEQAEADILGNMADGGTSCHWCIDKHKTAAIREFVEAAKNRIVSDFLTATGGENTAQSVAVLKVLEILDEIKNEMTEDNNA